MEEARSGGRRNTLQVVGVRHRSCFSSTINHLTPFFLPPYFSLLFVHQRSGTEVMQPDHAVTDSKNSDLETITEGRSLVTDPLASKDDDDDDDDDDDNN